MPRNPRTLSLSVLTALLVVAGCTSREVPTPLELAEGDVLTSYEDMLSFLGDLQAETGSFTMDTIGMSVEGRSLILLRFNGPFKKDRLRGFHSQPG